MSGAWNDADKELACSLWLAGESAGRIADRLRGRTRCAVLGMLHRMGLPKVNKDAKRDTLRRRVPRGSRPKRRALEFHKVSSARRLLTDGKIDLAPDTPPETLVKLIDLTPTCCRWSYGDPKHAEFGFCGRTQIPGTPYCEMHVRRAYVVIPPKKTEKQSVNEPAKAPEMELT